MDTSLLIVHNDSNYVVTCILKFEHEIGPINLRLDVGENVDLTKHIKNLKSILFEPRNCKNGHDYLFNVPKLFELFHLQLTDWKFLNFDVVFNREQSKKNHLVKHFAINESKYIVKCDIIPWGQGDSANSINCKVLSPGESWDITAYGGNITKRTLKVTTSDPSADISKSVTFSVYNSDEMVINNWMFDKDMTWGEIIYRDLSRFMYPIEQPKEERPKRYNCIIKNESKYQLKCEILHKSSIECELINVKIMDLAESWDIGEYKHKSQNYLAKISINNSLSGKYLRLYVNDTPRNYRIENWHLENLFY